MYIDEDSIQKIFGITPQRPSSRRPSVQSTPCPERPPLKSQLSSEHSSLDGYSDDPESAFKKIERLLSVRDRSIFEMRDRLQQARFTERAIDESLQRAIRCGYLDDERFADGFVRSRLRASKGIDGIVRDLKRHAIDAYSIPGFPDAYLEEQGGQLENAVLLLQRKPPHAKNKRQAAYAKLIRNGFSSSIAYAAVKTWVADAE